MLGTQVPAWLECHGSGGRRRAFVHRRALARLGARAVRRARCVSTREYQYPGEYLREYPVSTVVSTSRTVRAFAFVPRRPADLWLCLCVCCVCERCAVH